MEKGIPYVTLNSGHAMPVIGLGTAGNHQYTDLVSTFLDALKAGYRHFDTASFYGTEQPLGRAVAQALEQGLIESRDELFITSKLWCADADPELVLPALKKSLENLGLDYLDLYLIHWPVKLKKSGILFPFNKEDILPFDMKITWEAMEECCRLGLVKSVGSEQLLIQEIVPVTDTCYHSSSWNQKKLREFCKEKGVHVTAWSPLGANGASWGSLSVMQSPVLKEIATQPPLTILRQSP